MQAYARIKHPRRVPSRYVTTPARPVLTMEEALDRLRGHDRICAVTWHRPRWRILPNDWVDG